MKLRLQKLAFWYLRKTRAAVLLNADVTGTVFMHNERGTTKFACVRDSQVVPVI